MLSMACSAPQLSSAEYDQLRDEILAAAPMTTPDYDYLNPPMGLNQEIDHAVYQKYLNQYHLSSATQLSHLILEMKKNGTKDFHQIVPAIQELVRRLKKESFLDHLFDDAQMAVLDTYFRKFIDLNLPESFGDFPLGTDDANNLLGQALGWSGLCLTADEFSLTSLFLKSIFQKSDKVKNDFMQNVIQRAREIFPNPQDSLAVILLSIDMTYDLLDIAGKSSADSHVDEFIGLVLATYPPLRFMDVYADYLDFSKLPHFVDMRDFITPGRDSKSSEKLIVQAFLNNPSGAAKIIAEFLPKNSDAVRFVFPDILDDVLNILIEKRDALSLDILFEYIRAHDGPFFDLTPKLETIRKFYSNWDKRENNGVSLSSSSSGMARYIVELGDSTLSTEICLDAISSIWDGQAKGKFDLSYMKNEISDVLFYFVTMGNANRHTINLYLVDLGLIDILAPVPSQSRDVERPR